MKILYIITTISIAIAIFFGGFATHILVLSKSNVSPEKLQVIIDDQNSETQALQKSIAAQAKRIEISLKILEIDKARIATLEQEQSELQQKFTSYRNSAEKDRANLKRLETFLRYQVTPVTVEEIIAIEKYIAAIHKELAPAHLRELQKLDSYQKLKALLKKLPHRGV